MKKTLLFLFLLFCITLSVSAQKPNSVPTVVHFIKSDTNAFITHCDIDTVAKKIYYYNCYGGLFTYVFIAKPDLDIVLAKHFSPFDYFDVVLSDYATVIDNAKKELQANGTNVKFTAEENGYLQINDSVKFPSTLSKLLELDRQLVAAEADVTRFHSVNPKNIVSTDGYGGSFNCPYGQMILQRTTDTIVTFYNKLDEMPLFKALMDINKGVIYYYCRNDNYYDLSNHYDYNGNVVDELQISKEKVNLILKEKFDVFALYRIWLEWQRQIVTDAMQQTEHRASVAALKKYAVNDWIVQLKTFAAIESKIDYCTHADQRYVLQHLRKDFAHNIPDATKAWETGRMISYTTGDKQYELRDHRGNVMVVISDAKKGIPRKDDSTKVDHYEAIVLSAKDYSSFGAPLEGRSFNSGSYPYGFNGKRDDTETEYQDYGMRIYDPQIARFLSVDALTSKYPYYSPYQFAGNNPIFDVDVDGLEPDKILNKSESLLNTPYEFGGKNPASELIGSIKPGTAGRRFWEMSLIPALNLISDYDIQHYAKLHDDGICSNEGIKTLQNEIKASVYKLFSSLTQKGHSIGIDCSGFVCASYLEDKELLFDPKTLATGSGGQLAIFNKAVNDDEAYVHHDFNLVSAGDFIYKSNHVMIATGNVKEDKKGNVTEFETYEANSTKEGSIQKWRKADSKKYTIGHPFRTSDTGSTKSSTPSSEAETRTKDNLQQTVVK